MTLGNTIKKTFIFWCRGIVVITTAQLHSAKSELKFCAGSNPARSVCENGVRMDSRW